jgi:hypothetical protein
MEEEGIKRRESERAWTRPAINRSRGEGGARSVIYIWEEGGF